MISRNTFPTYAQYNEDLILLALLSDVQKGFYVDVGANYPIVDSVTKLFYEKGWKGINIEPLTDLYEQLAKDRPRDVNLQIGIGDKPSEMEFFENIDIPGHSSFILTDATHQDSNIRKHTVKVKTLTQVFKENNVGDIHFLKIDVEGYEGPVIAGNDWELYRPYVICIEANHRKTAWQEVLKLNNYNLFINDGLNEYYVAKEHWGITEGFADKVVKTGYHALKQHQYQSWKQDSKELRRVTRLNQAHFEIVQSLRNENDRLRYENRFSLVNKTYGEKIKLILRALPTSLARRRGIDKKS